MESENSKKQEESKSVKLTSLKEDEKIDPTVSSLELKISDLQKKEMKALSEKDSIQKKADLLEQRIINLKSK